VNRELLKGWSHHLGREMELLWFGHAGIPAILFPTSMARYYEVEDFGLIGGLRHKIEAGLVQAVCVDSVATESWYNKRVHPAVRRMRHEQYDAYLHHELVPYIRHRTQRNDLAVYGASFGAYQAMNFACRYPGEVTKSITFSGVYDIHDFLDGHWDDGCYFNCPTAYVPNMDEENARRLSQVQFVIATGEHDTLVEANRHFAGMLAGKGVPVHCEIWPGQFGHDWPWWIGNLPRFLP
jgi:esterase/lipase superfamily enzyme